MLTVIDQVANQNHLQLVKAALPYLPPSRQRTLSVCIKMMELRNLMSYFDSHPSCVQACAAGSEPPTPTDILLDIRNYCEGEEQAMVDQWLQMLSTLELYSVLAQQTTDGTGSANTGFGKESSP